MPDPLDLLYPMMRQPALLSSAPPAPAPAESAEASALLDNMYPSMRAESEHVEEQQSAPPTEPIEPQDAGAAAAPEIVPPEGMTADPQAFAAFTKLATDAGIKPDVASAMLKMHADALASADYGRKEQVVQWAEDARADPEIGGQHFDATVASARAILDQYGDAELREALDRSGLGNHRSVIRLLARVSEVLSQR